MARRLVDTLPPLDVEYLLAHRLLADRNPLRRAVVLELLGHPRRYGELRETLRVKNDNQLTRALRYLQEEGIVYQRIDASRRPATYWYELGPLGRLVLISMLQMTPPDASARMIERGRLAAQRADAEA